MLFYVGLGILLVLGIYVLLKTKRTYDGGKAFSKELSVGWWILDAVHSLLVILSSLYTVWPIPINEIIALVGGSIMLGVGGIIMVAGMIEFRSLGRISGLETSTLMTTGIYGWSRNPQFFGLFLEIAGISLIGRSGFSFVLTIVAIIFCHYYITRMEEPYLEGIFGEKYLSYKSQISRYLGIPKRKESSPPAPS